MNHFQNLSFQDQRTRIDAACSEKDVNNIASLLIEAASLVDSEPLAYFVVCLAQRTLLAPHKERLAVLLKRLPDASLQGFVVWVAREPKAQLALQQWTCDALVTWPNNRLNARVFLRRWVRQNHPAAFEAISAATQEAWRNGQTFSRENVPPDPEPFDPRTLLFMSGKQLVAGLDGVLAPDIREASEAAIDTLAEAPKSISQANAEALLASSVYADPGHFFFELLQNADDSGATRWTAALRPDPPTVRITHDGEPFSLADLVGIVSIGQTNKQAGQIGRFGAGFKSVYQVCDRPRIHSGAFNFEIAHVSIPRRLSADIQRPLSTTLVDLPLRDGVNAADLMRRAECIPPETLLTLANVRSFQIDSGLGTRIGWTYHSDGARQTLTPDDDRPKRHFLSAAGELTFEGPRQPGHLRRSRVFVAVETRDTGHPVFNAGPTLYAFLPTAQHTGLRFMVHARFDVTLDRERLELESLWNDALLAEAGKLAAQLVTQFVAEGHSPLPLLSTPDALAPVTLPLIHTLRRALADQVCLPAANGQWLRPSDARLVSPRLIAPLANVDLGGSSFALASLDEREQNVALSFGARRFTTDDLVALVDSLQEGAPRPAWLGPAVLEALGRAPLSDETLRDLPILEDGNGSMCRPCTAFCASAEWVHLYRGIRPVVDMQFLARLPTTIRERVCPSALNESSLIEDLRSAMGTALIERQERLLAVLDTTSDATLEALSDIPIWRAGTGKRLPAHALRRLVSPLAEDNTPPLASENALAREIRKTQPLLDREHEDTWPELSRRWIRPLSLLDIPALLKERTWPEDTLAVLATLLDDHAGSLGPALSKAFAELPIFLDQHGKRRPLIGPTRALVTQTSSLAELLPGWPWLAHPRRAFVEQNNAGLVDAQQIASGLAAASESPLPSFEMDTAVYAELLDWIAGFSSEFGRGLIQTLGNTPIWPCRKGERHVLRALRQRGQTAHVERFYDLHANRPVAADVTLRLATALGLEHQIQRSDEATVAFDLINSPVTLTLSELAPLLNGAAVLLSDVQLTQLTTTALFRDSDDQQCCLTRLDDQQSGACVVPGDLRDVLERGALPLLDPEHEQALGPFLKAAGLDSPKISALIRRLELDDALFENHSALQGALLRHADSLTAEDRLRLVDLPLFDNRRGEHCPIRSLGDGALIETLFEGREFQQLQLDAHLMAPNQASFADTLGLVPLAAADLLTAHILPSLKEGTALSSLPAPWTTRASLARLLSWVHASGLEPEDYPIGLDQHARLCHPPLSAADEKSRHLLACLPASSARFLTDRPLADLEWSSLAENPAVLIPLRARDIVLALAATYPRTAKKNGCTVFPDPEILYAWILEHRHNLCADPTALDALGSAALFPSENGTLKAARDLILDIHLPDIGLGWGVGKEVPESLVQWLRSVFEFDRHQRRLVITYVLDALDEAAHANDPRRAHQLISFLARTLDAGAAEPVQLAARVRHTKIRARLKVPLRATPDGPNLWDKARRGWLGTAEDAQQAARLCSSPPPRCTLDLDEDMSALLVACGASAGLPDATLRTSLAHTGQEAETRRELARYILRRVEAEPELRRRLNLDELEWIPGRTGMAVIHFFSARSLVWPSPPALSLLGAESTHFPESSFCKVHEGSSTPSFGFRALETLPLAELLPPDGTPARTALLEWLEDGLHTGRLTVRNVKRLRDDLLIADDDGRPRLARNLAVTDCHSLLGDWRGEFSEGHRLTRLRRALAIPFRPGSAMVLSVIADVSAALEQGELNEVQKRDLRRRLPIWFEALGEWLEHGESFSLGAVIWTAALQGERVELRRLSGPNVCLFEPASFSEALPATLSDVLAEIMPLGTTLFLRTLLISAGARDLRSLFRVTGVIPGPDSPDHHQAGAHLHKQLHVALESLLDTHVRVVDSLSIRGVIPVDGQESENFVVQVDSALWDGTLWLTPDAITEPARLACALEPNPKRRQALRRWLLAGDWQDKAPAAMPKTSVKKERSIFDRIRKFFDDKPKNAEAEAEAGSARGIAEGASGTGHGSFPTHSDRDQELFRETTEIRSQLKSAETWLARRTTRPEFGFLFEPKALPAPWMYAPKFVSVDFEPRTQRWQPCHLDRPTAGVEAGSLILRGKLPAGLSVLPIPTFGTVQEVQVDGTPWLLPLPTDATGGALLGLRDPGDVRVRVRLGSLPDLRRAIEHPHPGATAYLVPDDELPLEALDLVSSLDPKTPPAERAMLIRDFIRARYRYEPSYLEQPAVAEWLSRLTAGRHHRHIAALHAGADDRHLGAGVCFELNTLACELLRRAGIPAAVATGWVMVGGALSEADHLWCIALLQDHTGNPLWLPIDASTTETGRPLRVQRRPPGRFRAPRDRRAKTPTEPEAFRTSASRPARSRSHGQKQKRAKQKHAKRTHVPRAEMLRLLTFLERLAGRELSERERRKFESALSDPELAKTLLDSLL